MTAKMNQLQEVEIREIDAVSTGILKTPLNITPAERRLRSARRLYVDTLKGGGVGLSLDPVINYLTGRTKKLKSELEVEQYGSAVRRMQDWYGTEHYGARYRITPEESLGFEYFCVEDEVFRHAVTTGNRSAADRRIGFLALAFLELQDGDAVTNPKKG